MKFWKKSRAFCVHILYSQKMVFDIIEIILQYYIPARMLRARFFFALQKKKSQNRSFLSIFVDFLKYIFFWMAKKMHARSARARIMLQNYLYDIKKYFSII